MTIRTVLYIPTQIIGTRRYFTWAAYPNIWYARLQSKVLNILDSYDNIESFVKFYPNDILKNPNKDWVQFESSNVNILEENLVDILNRVNFDLIITEACATTLLEAICTKSQILAFFPEDYIKINTELLEILKKRVHLSNSENSYLDLLKVFMDKGFCENKKELNDEFLFKFGLSELSFSPVELARKNLIKIIE